MSEKSTPRLQNFQSLTGDSSIGRCRAAQWKYRMAARRKAPVPAWAGAVADSAGGGEAAIAAALRASASRSGWLWESSARELVQLLEPALRQRIRLACSRRCRCRGRPSGRARVAEERLQRLALERGIDAFAHERGEIGMRREGFERREGLGRFGVVGLRRGDGARRGRSFVAATACARIDVIAAQPGLQVLPALARLDLAARPAREEVVVAHREPSLRSAAFLAHEGARPAGLLRLGTIIGLAPTRPSIARARATPRRARPARSSPSSAPPRCTRACLEGIRRRRSPRRCAGTRTRSARRCPRSGNSPRPRPETT